MVKVGDVRGRRDDGLGVKDWGRHVLRKMADPVEGTAVHRGPTGHVSGLSEGGSGPVSANGC